MAIIKMGDGHTADFSTLEAGGTSVISEDAAIFKRSTPSTKFLTDSSGSLCDGRVNLSPSQSETVVGGYFRIPTFPGTSDRPLVLIFYNSQTYNASIRVSSGGVLKAYVGANGSPATVSGPTIVVNQWYLLECALASNIGTVTFDWRVDSVDKTRVTDATDHDVASDIRFGAYFPSTPPAEVFTVYVDDWIIGNSLSDYPTNLGDTSAKAGSFDPQLVPGIWF